ncbi:shikimate kinase [Microbacterium sp. VKM Ac-2870]|uniref:shikimate kinase n=1 Tax=Microbacterium sp. VKM Ac-2870 TaxID=2783825 RepID=UPI00188B9C6E|nr:shikimate kinase [Microbacterium sp. VKM Ac-2870]MBF4560933.1 shikimate kinase [Microbacterium sp. VKM Ac-2870]
MTDPAIVLIGPMGAGKTSVGKRVAKRLALPFTDSDAVITREHGPITEIFARQGEESFRELERRAVSAALATGGVVALGGGAVLHPETQTDLAAHRVVLLTVAPQNVAARIRGGARPLLQEGDAVARWHEIFAQRRPVYERLADITFDTSAGPLQDVVEALATWITTDGTGGDDRRAPGERQ